MSQLVKLTLGARSEIELCNPPLNLVSRELTVQLRVALSEVSRSPSVRALVLHGGGKAFCAGSDVKEFERLHGRDVAQRTADYMEYQSAGWKVGS